MPHAQTSLPRTRNALAPAALAAALLIAGCQAPQQPQPVETWPADPPQETVLEQTQITPGTPEYRPPTAPPSPEPTHRPTPPPAEPEQQRPPVQRPPSPHPPGVPRGDPAEAPEPDAVPEVRELFPHIRVDVASRIIEFDGIVPIDAHDPEIPRVYLEVIVCTPDSKEHESLVMTPARPSHVHAALLAIGLTPGHPGRFEWEGGEMTTIPPEGDPVIVTFIYNDDRGTQHEIPATRWVVNAEDGTPFVPGNADDDSNQRGFVFAGSVMRERMGRERYDADGVGTLIGLHTFGAETIAWRQVMSPDSQVETPEWIADAAAIPPFDSKVTVRIRPAE